MFQKLFAIEVAQTVNDELQDDSHVSQSEADALKLQRLTADKQKLLDPRMGAPATATATAVVSKTFINNADLRSKPWILFTKEEKITSKKN